MFIFLSAIILAINAHGEDGEYDFADLAGIFQFDINLNEPFGADCYDSPTILLNNLNWTLKLCTRGEHVKLELSAVPNFNSSHWKCEADIKIKLHSHSAVVTHNRKNWVDLKFSNEQHLNSYDRYMTRNSLDHFVKDNKITFEVELSTTSVDTRPPKPIPEIFRTDAKIYLKLKNYTTFQKIVSPEINVQGVKWRVCVEKKFKRELHATLLADPNDFNVNSLYKVSGTFKLLSFNNIKANFEQSFVQDFGRCTTPSIKVLSLDELIWSVNEFYVKDNCANIVAEFKVQKTKQPLGVQSEINPNFNWEKNFPINYNYLDN